MCINKWMNVQKLILIYNINWDLHKIPSLRVAIPSFPGDLSHHQTHNNTLTVHLHPKHWCMTLNTKTKTHTKSNNTVTDYIKDFIHIKMKILLSCTSHTPEYFIVISFKLNKVFRVFRHDFKDHFTRDWSFCPLS